MCVVLTSIYKKKKKILKFQSFRDTGVETLLIHFVVYYVANDNNNGR